MNYSIGNLLCEFTVWNEYVEISLLIKENIFYSYTHGNIE